VLLARLLALVMLCAAPVGPTGVAASTEEDESAHVEQQASLIRHRAVTQPPLPAPPKAARARSRSRRRVPRRHTAPRRPRPVARHAGRPRRIVLYDDDDDDPAH